MVRSYALLLIIFLAFQYAMMGQRNKSLEAAILTRYDMHADYLSNYGGRVYDDHLKLYGASFGAGINYRMAVGKFSSAYVGMGYYQLNIDKISGPKPRGIPGTINARNINYRGDSTLPLHSTSDYRYNNLSFTLGAGYLPFEGKNLELGAELVGYYSFSQRYKLNHYSASRSQYWRTRNSKAFEFGANVTIGFYRDWTRFYIRPAIVVPILQNLKGDKVFYEDEDQNLTQWFSGLGLKVIIGHYKSTNDKDSRGVNKSP
jgi:hypothetical protein